MQKSRGIIFFLGGLVILLTLLPSTLAADDEDLRIDFQEVVNDFPDGINFRMGVTGPDQVEEIRVFVNAEGSDAVTYGYLDIEPGTEVDGEYYMTIGRGAGHRPPGISVTYSFEIRDSSGRIVRTDDEEFLYLDPALEWQSISEGLLTVYYYGAFVERRARTVLEAAQETMEVMGRVLGIESQEPATIVSYSNYRDMTRALPFRSQAVREGLRTEGQAWPNERVLLVLSAEQSVTGIASHEFTHILVAEAAGIGYNRVPAWLNEGLAEYGNIDQTPLYDQALRFAIFTRRVKPLWQLNSFGGEPDDVIIGYGQGKSAVEFLITVYGEGKMADLMGVLRTDAAVDEALETTYGFDQHGLDSIWRISLGLRPLPSPDEVASLQTPDPQVTTLAETDPALGVDESEDGTGEPSVEEPHEPSPRGGCNSPTGEHTGVPLEAGMLALTLGALAVPTARKPLNAAAALLQGIFLIAWLTRILAKLRTLR